MTNVRFPALFLMTLTAVAVATAVPAGAQAIQHQIILPAGDNWCSDSMIDGLYNGINAYRAQHGEGPLAMNSLGMKDAEMRATQLITYMANYQPGTPFNPHTGWDTTAAGIGYDVVGENLAWVDPDANDIVNNIWQDSLHEAAMLSTNANIMGVSCVYGPNGQPYWTYDPGFCSNCGAPPTPTPTPKP